MSEYKKDISSGSEIINKGIRNIKYTFVAQMIVMGTGILKTLFIPTFLSVESYAYWQIYLFYLSYIGLFYLGFNDGILLKYGSYNYKNLPFPMIRMSMRFYIGMLSLFSIIMGCIAISLRDSEKCVIISTIALSIPIYGINGVLVYILLITNQIKKYSFFTSVDQVAVLITAVCMHIVDVTKYKILIYASFCSKLILVAIMIYMCKDIFIGKTVDIKRGFSEFTENIRFGISLMLAQIMSMLLTGLGRMFVEYFGDIREYAYYAFGMSVINIVMVCITAVSTVMYPTLSRVEKNKLPRYFDDLCSYITVFNLVALFTYFPAVYLVEKFFAKYVPMLSFLYFFFAMLTWQSKINIAINSYFRVLRKESKMFVINVLGVLFFSLTTLPLIMFTHSIKIVAFTTFLTMLLIEIVSEVYLRKKMKLTLSINTLRDILINIVFLYSCIKFEFINSTIIYSVFAIIYILIERKRLMPIFNKVIGLYKL